MVGLWNKPKPPFVFTHSVVGQSHIKHGKPCQDASLCVQDKKYTWMAVADGHGGDRYFRSDMGSRFAVQAARECMTDSVVIKALDNTRTDKERETFIRQLKKSIVGRWNELVAAHAETHPFTEKEIAMLSGDDAVEPAYGSTLIAVLWADNFLLILQIGDGSCVFVDGEGVFSKPVPEDERCFLNVTTSICDKNAADVFRHVFIESLPAAVLIGTDGIDDCFAGDEKLYDFYRVILSSFTDSDEETAKTELADYLPRLSEKAAATMCPLA